MNFVKQFAATFILCLALQYFLPWWTLVIGAAVAGYWADNRGFVAFAAGFLGVAVLWWVTAFLIDAQTGSILTEKVAKLLFVETSWLLVLITGFIGGLCGGFAGLTGALVKK